MDELIKQQERISGHIVRAFENLKKLGQSNITQGVVEAKLSVLEEKWKKFQEIDNELEKKASGEDRERNYFANDVSGATENGYLLNKGKLLDSVRQFKTNNGAAAKQISGACQLQKIDLPKFSGEFTEWQPFRDLFSSMVGDNASISAIEKMHYLKMSLTSEPAALIASLPPTADNLAAAWKILTDRYQNTRLLTTSHLASIFNLQPVNQESSSGLKTLFNGTINAVSALKALGRPVNGYDDFLVYLTVQKLDKQSRREWESVMGSKKVPPTFAELQTFLESRICSVQGIESLNKCLTTTSRTSAGSQSKSDFQKNNSLKSHQATKSAGATKKKCSFCAQEHFIAFCRSFSEKTAAERKAFVTEKRLCFNCLGQHMISDCRSVKSCQTCKGKHHTLIHDENSSAAVKVTSVPSSSQASGQRASTTTSNSDVSSHNVQCLSVVSQPRILLATAVVNVLTAGGAPIIVRALLDQGSEASFVSESLAQRLKLPRAPASVSITGIGAKSASTTRGLISLNVTSHFDMSRKFVVDAFILPKLTAYMPPPFIVAQQGSHLDSLTLADPDVASTQKIDLLVGAETFSEILLPGIRRGNSESPVAQNTQLGWILSGRIHHQTKLSSNTTSLQLSVDTSLGIALQKFWDQEEISSPRPLTPEEQECENLFNSTHSRDIDGRYIVRLPFKGDVKSLGDSISAASRMLSRMQRRFSSDLKFEKAYSDFMKEYEDLNHMEAVSKTREEPSLAYYLPHHGVIRESSETTKLRVVFNGSQKTNRNVSLNELLHVGSNLLPELMDIIISWRRHAIVFSADMEKMYRQIVIHPEDRDFQRVLWQVSPDKKQTKYRLNTVTYGLSCAPFLALRVIRQLALDEQARAPRGSASLLKDVYVDDVLSGDDDVTSALAKQREIIELLKAGGFSLRKWTSNSTYLLSHLPPSFLAVGTNLLVPSEREFHMLGLLWKSEGDFFVFNIKSVTLSRYLTKRKILSRIAELFDPLGWIAPVVIKAKIFMQSLWLLKLNWDDVVPEKAYREWNIFHEDLHKISTYQIPRWINLYSNSKNIEIHGFCDASERAYAAVVYLCVGSKSRSVALLAAKTKVAPVKQVTLPRLELRAAHLLVKLVKHLSDVLALEITTHLWSDSTVALAWIQGHPSRWKTYVANRVAEIQVTLPEAVWHHVESSQNPADCASRGILASELQAHPLWWNGPSWLQTSESEWPSSAITPIDNPTEQRVHSHVAQGEVQDPCELLTRYSTLTRTLRITAWCQRFIKNVRQGNHTASNKKDVVLNLSPAELENAMILLINLEQSRFFKEEILSIQSRSIPSKGLLLKLTPFVDKNGQLRVGGRLKHSILDADEKHPLIIPRDSAITPLLIASAHIKTLHGGTQLTLATLRQRYWIISARSLVKSFIGRCTRCLRYRATKASQLMGNLPQERVTKARPFFNCGVDYAGPVHLRTSKGRGQKAYKAFISVFVCFATRAVHLEVVSDYSTEGFLAAYRRFTSRRGLCHTISSDCGTNFVGADKELRNLFASASAESNHIQSVLANDGVEWKFNPPASPHFGGLWEAAVKSVKHHLRRVIGESKLTFEEMATLLAQIEACLNSRPLQAFSDDPDDLNVLTPGHFLIGGPLSAVPEPGLSHLQASRLSRWQLIQQMRDSFWNRWSTEYLHQLQQRNKWQKPQRDIHVGDIVLVTNDISPPTKWPLARVTEIHAGSDGRIRVVTVKTATSSLKRPVVKLCVLQRAEIC